MMLFSANQLGWTERSSREVPIPEPEEEPWLQPVWRDPKGEYHYCHFDLVRRHFADAIIHEDVFTYAGQHHYDLQLDLETLLHKKYKRFRCSGEWFELLPRHIEAILDAASIEDLVRKRKATRH